MKNNFVVFLSVLVGTILLCFLIAPFIKNQIHGENPPPNAVSESPTIAINPEPSPEVQYSQPRTAPRGRPFDHVKDPVEREFLNTMAENGNEIQRRMTSDERANSRMLMEIYDRNH